MSIQKVKETKRKETASDVDKKGEAAKKIGQKDINCEEKNKRRDDRKKMDSSRNQV